MFVAAVDNTYPVSGEPFLIQFEKPNLSTA
jgi:hypothetical protein